ncbi:helix-turn-helix domain-containing protein [Bacillus sp. 1P06AnD]|uniref:helix-turn-helix domain-containing protein n=1 Tax=Bacillus sp. 1P06AnD TaxID=3132208 RepID=UPI0039A22821
MEALGKLVHFHRKRQNKTQETLCSGICSVTHLSKIENGYKEGSAETLRLLFERLGVKVETEKSKTNELKKELDEFYLCMMHLNERKAECIYTKLKAEEEYIQYTELVYLYQLYCIRYDLFIGNLEKADASISRMIKSIKKFSQLERYLLHYFHAIYLIKRKNFEEALGELDISQGLGLEFEVISPEFDYHKALIYSQLQHSTLAMHYSHTALKRFEKDHNFLRIMDTNLIIAINLTKQKQFREAERIYTKLLRDAELYSNKKIMSMILHNFGYLYCIQDQYSKAIEYYRYSLDCLNCVRPDHYSATTSNIVNLLIIEGKKEEALLYTSKAISFLQKYENRKVKHILSYWLQLKEMIFNDKKITSPSFYLENFQ